MKIFGTVFPFVEPNDHSFRMGRFIANYEFLVALLNHSQFECFHLFCMNPLHLQSTAQRLSDDQTIDNAAKSKIQLFLYSSLTEKLESEHYHIFHLGGWGYFFAGLAYLRNRFATSPFPITGVIHSLNARDTRYDYYKLLKAPLASCDAIVCTSEAGREVMVKQLERISALERCQPFKGQMAKIPLGVFDTAAPDKQTSRRALALDDDSILILYIGRLSPNTKADLYPLLLCFQQLVNANQLPIKLLLAGGADATEQTLHQDIIRELELEQSVSMLANFDPLVKRQLYAAADICVAPSDNIQETFGISIIEGMLAGLPVVAADLDGYRELVDDGDSGFLINTTWIDQLELAEMDEIMSNDSLQTLLAQAMVIDLEQLQQKLQLLIDHPELRQQLGNRGQQKAREHYLWPVVIKQYESLWQQLYEEARHCTFETPEKSLFSNDFLTSFSHYPTHILNHSMQVGLTDSGQRCLQTGQTPPIYSDVAMLLDQDWLAAVMNDLVINGGNITVGELLSTHGDKNHRRRFSLLWAAKYGLIRLRAL